MSTLPALSPMPWVFLRTSSSSATELTSWCSPRCNAIDTVWSSTSCLHKPVRRCRSFAQQRTRHCFASFNEACSMQQLQVEAPRQQYHCRQPAFRTHPFRPRFRYARARARRKEPARSWDCALTGSAPAPIRTLTRSSTRTTSSSVVSMAFTSSCTRSFARWPSDVRHLRNRWSARATFIRIHSLIHPIIAASLLSIQSSLSLSLSSLTTH